MRYLHAMVRVLDVEKALDFYVNKLGLKEISRKEKSLEPQEPWISMPNVGEW